MKSIVYYILFILLSEIDAFAMTWSQTWDDILAGGSPRWKVDSKQAKQVALDHITRHAAKGTAATADDDDDQALNIFCPLAGDDLFVYQAWSQGHAVTAVDLVSAAVAAMRAQFGPDEEWTSSSSSSSTDGMVVWKHKSGRATLYQGDALKKLNELQGTFDAVYDKDSFGALDISMRETFCERLADYTKQGGIVYVEVKNKPEGPGRLQGPPFHLEKKDLLEESNFGRYFEHVEELGEVYTLSSMPGIKQMGHVLKRLPK